MEDEIEPFLRDVSVSRVVPGLVTLATCCGETQLCQRSSRCGQRARTADGTVMPAEGKPVKVITGSLQSCNFNVHRMT